MKRYYGQWVPEVDRVLDERYFKDRKNLVSIECGAFDGIIDSCTKFFEDNYNWKTINIEPVPYLYQLLCKNRPNSINLKIALSDDNCKKKFTQVIHPILGNNFGNG